MKNISNKFLILLMVVLTSTTLLSCKVVNAEDTYSESNLAKYLTSGSSVTIGKTTITPGQKNTIDYATDFTVVLTWAFTDSEYPRTTSDKLTYTLPSGLSLSGSGNLFDGTNSVGTYNINGSIITITYTSETFLKQSKRVGKLTLNGALSDSITKNGEGSDASLSFEGLGTFTFHMNRDNTNDGVSISKIAGDVDTTDNKANFKLKITAKGSQTNVTVTDTMGDNLTYNEDIKFYTDEACTQEKTGITTTVNENKKGFTSNIASMNSETLYAKYSVTFSNRAYASDGWNGSKDLSSDNKNTAKVTSSEDTKGKEETKEINISKIYNWASKSGKEDSDGNITWTITINPNNTNMDIRGSIIKDTLDANKGMTYVENSFSVNPSIEGLTYSSLTSESGFTMPENSKGTYTITYKTTAGDTTKSRTNKITINPFGDTRNYDYTGTVGQDHVWITKTCLTNNGTNTEVEWKVTVNVGADTENLKVVDTLPADFTFTNNSENLTLDGDNTTWTGTLDTSKVTYENNVITINFGQANKGNKITFTLKTTLRTIPSEQKQYTNNAKYYDGETEKGSADAYYTYVPTNYLTKEYDWNNKVWQLKISKLETTESSITIIDTMPENTKYNPNTLVVSDGTWENNQLKDSAELKAGVSIKEENNTTDKKQTLTFTISGEALGSLKQKDLYIRFGYDFFDVNAATGYHTYTNKAKLKIGETTFPEVSSEMNRTFETKEVVAKTATYTEDTAPFVKYSIVVNSDAFDLNSNGDTLTLKDVLGNGLTYYMGSMKFKEDGKDAVAATSDQVSFDNTTNTLTIKVPDNKKITITYEAVVILEVGDTFTEESGKNVCALEGGNADKINSEKNLSGNVLESKGQSTSTGVSVMAYKYDETNYNTPLSGAKFKIYKVSYDASYNETGTSDEKVSEATDISGNTSISGLVRNQLYKLVESEAPSGYALDTTPRYFIFENKGAVDNNLTYPSKITVDGKEYSVTLVKDRSIYSLAIPNSKTTEESKGTLVITKTIEGDVTKKEAEGALKFKVTNSDSTFNNEYTLNGKDTDDVKHSYYETKKMWTITISNVPAGTYKVTEEVTNIEGKTYTVTNTVNSATVNKKTRDNLTISNGETTTVDYKNTYTTTEYDVEISKVSAADSKEISGASLVIYKDNENGTQVASWTSGSDGTNDDGTLKTHTVRLKPGTYVLKESLAPNGYDIASSITFTVANDGTVSSTTSGAVNGKKVTMKDEVSTVTKYHATIYKVDKDDTSKKLAGAVLKITNNSTNESLSITTTTNGNTVQLVPGTYTLNEVTAPSGYKTAADMTFTISDKDVTVTMEDEIIKKEVTISKVDASNSKELPGAQLTITDQSGKEVEKWTSTNTKHNVQLVPGTYTLTEYAAPGNYEKAESITFTVDSNGKVTIDGKEVSKVVMKDEKIHDVIISKVDATGGQEIEGAKLTITKKDDAKFKTISWTSGEDGKNVDGTIKTHTVKLSAGTYTLTETTAPDGYEVAESITFTIDSDGTIKKGSEVLSKVVMKDTKKTTPKKDEPKKEEPKKYVVVNTKSK